MAAVEVDSRSALSSARVWLFTCLALPEIATAPIPTKAPKPNRKARHPLGMGFLAIVSLNPSDPNYLLNQLYEQYQLVVNASTYRIDL